VKELGSAGSFFKNPYVTQEEYEDIADIYPEVPHFPLPDGRVKIPAAWLIEKAGLKGYVKGNAAVYSKQPLVIVNNTGKAAPWEILSLERKIIRTVRSRFGVTLSPEVEHI
jgi:UDP-N-acetylmuramate dehydrogenase